MFYFCIGNSSHMFGQITDNFKRLFLSAIIICRLVCSILQLCSFSHDCLRFNKPTENWRKGQKHSNNWDRVEQRPLMCFLTGLPKSFSRNVVSSQYINLRRSAASFYCSSFLLLLETFFLFLILLFFCSFFFIVDSNHEQVQSSRHWMCVLRWRQGQNLDSVKCL